MKTSESDVPSGYRNTTACELSTTTEPHRVEVGVDDDVSAAVVQGVESVTGDDALAIEPLNDVVDPDALDSLFDSKLNGGSRDGGRVSFDIHGCHVVVEGGGEVYIYAEASESIER